MSVTEQVARRYYDAWTSGDSETVAALLAPDFHFAAGDTTIEGRDAFLAAGAFPSDAATAMVAEAYQGEVGFQMYDARRGERSVRIVEQLTVRDGLIAGSVFVADMGAFAAFAEP
jgi:ketosteroid isomerase-like protein